MKRGIRALAAAALAFFGANEAQAQQGAPALPRLMIVVGSPAGGGYDVSARLVARHFAAFLPGAPPIAVQNMPGAGSLIAANWLANSAPRDGTAIAILPNATLFEAMLGNPGAHFDARKMNIVGSLNDNTAIAAVWRTAPFATARDLFEREVLVGSSAATSNNSTLPNLLNSLIHTKFKVVNGYPGGAGVDLALERGEVQAAVGADYDLMKSTRSEWLRDGKVRILLQAALTRHRDLPDVPTVFDFAPPENLDVLRLLIARQSYGGIFMAPPGSPDATVAALRAGFDKLVTDADFLRDAEQSNLAIHASNAANVGATLGQLLASPPDVIARATDELRKVAPP